MQQLIDLYTAHVGATPTTVEPITGSGSNRQYVRLTDAAGQSLIGCVGTSVEENHAFVYLARHFAEKGLPVPRVVAVSADERCYLQEDLGTRSLFDALRPAREAGGRYGEAERALLRRTIAELPRLQVLGGQGLDFTQCYPQPAMDETNVLFDLNYFKYCFLKPVASACGIDFHELRLEQDFHALARDLVGAESGREQGEGSSFFLYRDFQARNVMLAADGSPRFIDFQGGRRGPLEYDLASFLWQASARYPQELREELIGVYIDGLKEVLSVAAERQHTEQKELASSSFDEAHFRHRLRLFVLFRLLQVLGAYGFRGYFERKQHFLDSIPPALANLRELLGSGEYGVRSGEYGVRSGEYGVGSAEYGVGSTGCGVGSGERPYPELRRVLEELVAAPSLQGEKSSGLRDDVIRNEAVIAQPAPLPDGRGVGVGLCVRIFSFSYKRGIPEDTSGNGGGYVFDCRSTHNPGRYEPYKKLTGLDEAVIRFLEDDGEILTFLDSVYRLADAHVERYLQRGFTDLMFSFGCTGGQHRSVYCAQHLAEHLHAKYGIRVELTHREQGLHTTFAPHSAPPTPHSIPPTPHPTQ